MEQNLISPQKTDSPKGHIDSEDREELKGKVTYRPKGHIDVVSVAKLMLTEKYKDFPIITGEHTQQSYNI